MCRGCARMAVSRKISASTPLLQCPDLRTLSRENATWSLRSSGLLCTQPVPQCTQEPQNCPLSSENSAPWVLFGHPRALSGRHGTSRGRHAMSRDAVANDAAAGPVTGAVAGAQRGAVMCGPGSGRWPIKRAVDQCRVLEIGELCDGGRWASQPRGRIRWVERDSKTLRAKLSYAIAWEDWPPGAPLLILELRYHPTPTAPESCDRIVLEVGDARRCVALCPGCGRP